MPTTHLTRIVDFNATHRLGTPETFGKAATEHGHRYQCRVTVAGAVEPARKGLMDLKALDALLDREVRTPFEGRSLNEIIPLPTGEALAVYVWDRLVSQLPAGVRLHAVRIQESPNLYSEYFGQA